MRKSSADEFNQPVQLDGEIKRIDGELGRLVIPDTPAITQATVTLRRMLDAWNRKNERMSVVNHHSMD